MQWASINVELCSTNFSSDFIDLDRMVARIGGLEQLLLLLQLAIITIIT